MHKKPAKIFTLLVCVLFVSNILAQKTQLELEAPLDIPLILSGNFGEFRGSHFHMGIDIKTQGREGFPVLAAADGKVMRIKVSPWGYGNALYLEHADGSSTVYAHLQSFAPEIQSWVTARQYSGRTFSYDARPSIDFMFAAGDTIGWSGNSGGSGGPHLHFEVRDAASHPVNPLFFNFDIADSRPPELGALIAIPVDSQGSEIRSLVTSCSAGDTISVLPGQLHLGIEAIDRLDAASNVCGIYRLEVTIAGKEYFSCIIDTLDYAVNKDMNAHVYYPFWADSRKSIHRFDRLPGDRLPIYSQISDLRIAADSLISVAVDCWDVHGNLSSSTFHLRGSSSITVPVEYCDRRQCSTPAIPTSKTHLAVSDIDVTWPKGSFYSREVATLLKHDSIEFSIGPFDAPLAKKFKCEVLSPDTSLTGWLARSVDSRGRVSGAVICRESGSGTLSFSTRKMGRYRLCRDTIPPRVLPKHSGTPVVSTGDLIFHIEDDIAGVSNITATIDGSWLLLRWDPKKKTAIYFASDGAHIPGARQFVDVIVEDAVGLKSSWSGYVQMQ